MIKLLSDMPPALHYGRYRLYTKEHVEFDALPAYADGGPALVVIDGWCESVSSLCRSMSSPAIVAADNGMHTLNLYRLPLSLDCVPSQRHELDGTQYPDMRSADRAAFNAGTLAFMVYEHEGARLGLPIAA